MRKSSFTKFNNSLQGRVLMTSTPDYVLEAQEEEIHKLTVSEGRGFKELRVLRKINKSLNNESKVLINDNYGLKVENNRLQQQINMLLADISPLCEKIATNPKQPFSEWLAELLGTVGMIVWIMSLTLLF